MGLMSYEFPRGEKIVSALIAWFPI
jgi:hypothetical protein